VRIICALMRKKGQAGGTYCALMRSYCAKEVFCFQFNALIAHNAQVGR
jgi:hypothetical protein